MKLNTPTVKMTGWYLLIIMCISLSFSFALYNLTTNQIGAGLRRQAELFREQRFPPPSPFITIENELLEAQIQEIHDRVLATLLLVNAAVFVIGGSASYVLARRTLQPIEDNLDAQRRFTADASHELRTPLTAIRTEIEVALRGGQPNHEESHRIMRSTLEEVQRLEHLSKGLLRLAQYEEQEQSLPMQKVDLKSVIADTVKQNEVLARQRQITIKSGLASGNVLGDHQSLVDLLGILIDNAIKYSPKKSIVIVETRETSGHMILSVKDQGIGIKASELPHIFDRFYRADASRSKEKTDGYGLGLSIAKQIVDRHHGSIEAHSTPGKGTTILVTLTKA